MKKFALLLTPVLIFFLLALYVFTPFGKTRIGMSDYYKSFFNVFYIDKYLIYYDLGYYGIAPIFPLIKKIPQAKVKSFELVGCEISLAKDDMRVYLIKGRLDENRKSFNTLTIMEDVDAKNFRMVGNTCSTSFEDGQKVFSLPLGSKEIISYDSDPDSFTFIQKSLSTRGYDKDYYYCNNEKYALPETFYLYGCSDVFARDEDSVYYIGEYVYIDEDNSGCFSKINGADVETFRACGSIGEDKDNLYFAHKKIEKDDNNYTASLDLLDKCFKEKVSENIYNKNKNIPNCVQNDQKGETKEEAFPHGCFNNCLENIKFPQKSQQKNKE